MPAGKGGGGSADFNTRDIIEMTPTVNAGGVNIGAQYRPGGFGYQITGGATPERTSAVQGMSTALSNKAQEFNALRQEVRPGYGRLTQSRLADLESRRRARMGDLRQSLSRRRVLGSNFARAEISREESAFNQQRDQITAESLLQELAASVQLVGQEFDAKASSFQTLINEYDFEANIALALATGSQQVYGSLKSQAMALETGAGQASAAGINGVFGNILGQASSYGFSQLPQAGGGAT